MTFMKSWWVSIVVAGFVLLAFAGLPTRGEAGEAPDPRMRYRTRSKEAAQKIQKASQLLEDGQNPAALVAIEAALHADANCQMAHYYRGMILRAMGEIDGAVAEMQKTVELRNDLLASHFITRKALGDIGLLYLTLGEMDKGLEFCSQCLMEDSTRDGGLRYMMYRNMAYGLRDQKKHASAASVAMLAYAGGPQELDAKKLEAFIREIAPCNVIEYLPRVAAPMDLAERAPSALKSVGDVQVQEELVGLLCADNGTSAVGWADKSAAYYEVSLVAPYDIRRHTLSAPIVCADLRRGRLYAVLAQPARLVAINLKDDSIERTWKLAEPPPTTLAVSPSAGVAVYPFNGVATVLKLDSGGITPSDIPCEAVCSSQDESHVAGFCRRSVQRHPLGAYQIGRELFVWSKNPGNTPEVDLFMLHPMPDNLVLGQVRVNVCAGTMRPACSADGRWVCGVGSQGWVPNFTGLQGGAGVAVFNAGNLEELGGFLPVRGAVWAAINPVTNLVALGAPDGVYVAHMAKPADGRKLPGAAQAGLWTHDGKRLVLCRQRRIEILEDTLNAVETARADRWLKEQDRANQNRETQLLGFAGTADESIQDFELRFDPQEIRIMLKQIFACTSVKQRANWSTQAEYVAGFPSPEVFAQLRERYFKKTLTAQDLVTLEKLVDTDPFVPPAWLFLAAAAEKLGQPERAITACVNAVKSDGGRTEMQLEALMQLARLIKPSAPTYALYCLTGALITNPFNSAPVAELIPLLEQNGFGGEAAQLKTWQPVFNVPPPSQSLWSEMQAAVDALPDAKAQKLDTAELYKKLVPSTFVIETNRSCGTGFCVADGLVLTNYHVVKDASRCNVWSYTLKAGTPERDFGYSGKTVWNDPKRDLALIRFHSNVGTVPIPIRTSPPKPGERILVLGSPALADDLLVMTLTEGIVSGANRPVAEGVYHQMTAAVNPGNSGGPMVDEYGRVLGVVTLASTLQNVNFAIPITEAVAAIQETGSK